MTTSTSSRRPASVGPQGATRFLPVAAAAAATSLVWLVATAGLGLGLSQPGFGTQPPQPLALWLVTSFTLLAGLAAWGVLAVVERLARRPAGVWLTVSLFVLALSFGAPLSGAGIDAANRLALAAMHVAAGGVLIPLFYLSARRRVEVDR